jgi:hypothetical protein
MSQHTPGPWEVGNAPYSDCRIYAPSEVHAIAKTYGPDLNGIGVCALTGPMNRADARLIAAAPDLLDALREMYHAFLETEDSQTERQDAASLVACRAIFKATGGIT